MCQLTLSDRKSRFLTVQLYRYRRIEQPRQLSILKFLWFLSTDGRCFTEIELIRPPANYQDYKSYKNTEHVWIIGIANANYLHSRWPLPGCSVNGHRNLIFNWIRMICWATLFKLQLIFRLILALTALKVDTSITSNFNFVRWWQVNNIRIPHTSTELNFG